MTHEGLQRDFRVFKTNNGLTTIESVAIQKGGLYGRRSIRALANLCSTTDHD